MGLDLELELSAIYGTWSSGWGAPYSTVHDAASATYSAAESPTAANTRGVTNYLIKRGLIDIDCSDIPLLMSVTSAVLKMDAAWNLEEDRTVYATLVDATGVTADNAGFGIMLTKTASLGSVLVPVTGIWGTQTGDKEITLNAAGRALLEASAGGTARFGLRLSTDIDNEAPPGNNIQSFLTNPTVIEGEAVFSFGLLRVSSIRRIYRPGLYRMEVALGDLGFDVEVSEAAIKRVPDEVAEPEKPDEISEQQRKIMSMIAEHNREFLKARSERAREGTSFGMIPSTTLPSDIVAAVSKAPTTLELLREPTPTNILAALSPLAIGKTIYSTAKNVISTIFKGLFG